MNGNVIKNSYEPQNLQFIPVRKNMFDTVEIGISEVDGTQAEFVGNKNENTVVTLFQKACISIKPNLPSNMHFWFYLDVITMMNFYLTLPSNASSQIYSENNPGHYKVKLPRNIFLPENAWEVALASISFPDMVPRVDDFIYELVPILVRSNIHTKVTNSDGAPILVRRLINREF